MTWMIYKYFIQSEHIYAGQQFVWLFPEAEPLTVTLERQKGLNLCSRRAALGCCPNESTIAR